MQSSISWMPLTPLVPKVPRTAYARTAAIPKNVVLAWNDPGMLSCPGRLFILPDPAAFQRSRLEQALNHYADLPVGKLLERIMNEVNEFQEEQPDHMTLLVIKKSSAKGSNGHDR